MGVQWGYKNGFGHKKNPANVDLQGIKKAAPTGFEFVDFGFATLCCFWKSVYLQWFPPSFIMRSDAVLQPNGGTVGVQFRHEKGGVPDGKKEHGTDRKESIPE